MTTSIPVPPLPARRPVATPEPVPSLLSYRMRHLRRRYVPAPSAPIFPRVVGNLYAVPVVRDFLRSIGRTDV